MAELALDDDQRARLRAPSPRRGRGEAGAARSAGARRLRPRRVGAARGRPRLPDGRPPVAPLMTQNSGPMGSATRSSSQGWSSCQPQSSMPTSRRAALAAADEQRAAALIEIGLGEVERFLDAQSGSSKDDAKAAESPAVRAVSGGGGKKGCAASDPQEIPASSLAIGDDRRDRAADLTWPLLGLCGQARASAVSFPDERSSRPRRPRRCPSCLGAKVSVPTSRTVASRSPRSSRRRSSRCLLLRAERRSGSA